MKNVLKNVLFIIGLVVLTVGSALGIIALETSSTIIKFQSIHPDTMRLINIVCAFFLPAVGIISIAIIFIPEKLKKKFQFNISSIKIWRG